MPKQYPSIRVLIHGLSYFSSQLPAVLACEGWDIRNYDLSETRIPMGMVGHLARCDLVYTWAGRLTMGKFLIAARLLRKEKLVTFWCGSDVLNARDDVSAGRVVPWIAEKIHWAGAPWLAEEIRSLGLRCEYVPSTWVPMLPSVPELPAEFRVLAYLPDAERVKLYGIDQVLEVARALPAVQFTIAGLRPGQTLNAPRNVAVCGWVANSEQLYCDTTVLWRPTDHDGLSFMALEALAHGRYVIWSYPFTGAIQTRDPTKARIEIERLFEEHRAGSLRVNRVGAEFVAANFSQSVIREGLLGRWRAIVESPHHPAAPAYSELGAEKAANRAARSSGAN